MANFIGSDIKNIFSDTINKLRQDLGRDVLVMPRATNANKISCPNCGYDPIKRKSNNRYQPDSPYPTGPIGPNSIVGAFDFETANMAICPVCNGEGTIVTTTISTNILCLINALNKQEAEATPLGKEYSINYELSASIVYENNFKQADYVVVDGTRGEVVSVIPAGIGDLTQITVYVGKK